VGASLAMSQGKKLINSPSNCVQDAIKGLLLVNPGLQTLEGQNVVVRRDIDDVKADGKVALICGGGSGHEPAHAGYVGPGMLSAAVAGAVFASPSASSVLAAIRAVGRNNSGGVLVIVKNYTGDRLHFGLAVERAKAEGLLVDLVVVNEDCALTSADKTAGRRGLAGGVFIHKIAGCLAEEGRCLDDIVSTVKHAVENMGTIGLSLSPCSVPGSGPSFQLAHDEMELGLGIHGEAGVKRVKLCSAKEAVNLMLNHMTNPASSTCLTLNSGDAVALMVNNLGGTSVLEMHIIAKEAVVWLEGRGLQVDLVYCGSFVTSLEMAGVSLTVLKLNDMLTKCLVFPTSAPGWAAPLMQKGHVTRSGPGQMPCPADVPTQERVQAAPTISQGHSRILHKVISYLCEAVGNCENQLNILDTQSGDGDCGTTLKRGLDALCASLGPADEPKELFTCPHQLALHMAHTVEEAMGGSSGALYSLFLSAAAVPLVKGASPEHWLQALEAGIQAITKYGGAEPGDRTMLDALVPAYESCRNNLHLGKSYVDVLTEAAQSAEEGAAATTAMAARAGRASYVNPEHLKQPDPGAHAVGIWMRAVCEAFKIS